MRKLSCLFAVLLLLIPSALLAQGTPGPTPPGAVSVVTPVERSDAATNVAHSHTTGGTLTLSAGAAGGPTQTIYITGIDVSNCQSTTGVTAAVPTYITTTGINGSPQYQLGSGPATSPGLCQPTAFLSFTAPIKSQTPGTNVTFILPAFATNQVVSVNVYYRLGY
jgi:hypothetical protein